MPSPPDAAGRLLELANRLAALPAYNHRNPHAFHEGKSELAAELRQIAGQISGRRSIPKSPSVHESAGARAHRRA